MDRQRDGKVEYVEFLKLLEEARSEKRRIDRMRYIKARTEELKKENQLAGKEPEKGKIS